MTPFDDVAGKGKGSPRESNQGDLAVQFLSNDSNRLHQKREVLFGLDDPQLLDLLHLPDRMMKDGAFVLCKLKLNAHGLQRKQNVRKDDGGIDLKLSERVGASPLPPAEDSCTSPEKNISFEGPGTPSCTVRPGA